MASTLIAEVVKIEEIQPHPNADRMELARIKNWWCVVKLDTFQVGDKVMYIPPETVVPNKVAEDWGVDKYCSKLPKRGDGTVPPGLRIRAARLRGVPSFGLILPVANKDWPIGHSIIEEYDLKKYDPPPLNAGEAIGEPTAFHRYTDIENIGNYPNVFKTGEEVVVDEKIHGMNARCAYLYDGGEMKFFAGSHRQALKEVSDDGKPSTFWITMDERMKRLLSIVSAGTHNVVVFAEIFGRKIQDMEYGMDKIGYRAYDISVNGTYMNYDDKKALFQTCGIEQAPVLFRGKFSMETMQELVDGPTQMCEESNAGKFSGREGIVIRPIKEEIHPEVGRKILKMISVDYHERKGKKTEFH